MMKKLILSIIAIVGMLNVSNAQLKVHSNGYVSLGSTLNNVNSPVSFGGVGSSGYYVGYNGNMNGMQFTTIPTIGTTSDCYAGDFMILGGSTGLNCAIKGWASSTLTNSNSNLPTVIGVYGYGNLGSNSTGYGFGVRGYLSANRGAGVCGQSEYMVPNTVDDKYAGLFIGKTKVSGNLIVTGTIQGTLVSKSMPSEAEHIKELSSEKQTISEKIAELSAVAYNHPSSELEKEIARVNIELEDNAEATDSTIECKESQPDRNVLYEQVLCNKHYTIPVEQLEKNFPELVYVEENGTKHINYTEMIPLLVQCIGELQAKINTLTGEEKAKKAPTATSANSIPSLSQAILYQNTPNPFTERTEIRFSLPDDAQNAAICIFDMSGKMLKQISVTPAMQSVSINGYELSAGMYIYSLIVGRQEIDTKKMILSK